VCGDSVSSSRHSCAAICQCTFSVAESPHTSLLATQPRLLAFQQRNSHVSSWFMRRSLSRTSAFASSARCRCDSSNMHRVVMVHGQISVLVAARQGCGAGAMANAAICLTRHCVPLHIAVISQRWSATVRIPLHCDAIRPRQFALPSERVHA